VTRQESKRAFWGTGRRGLMVAAIAALTLLSAFWAGASGTSGTTRQSASWVSGSNADSPDDLAAPTTDSESAAESAVLPSTTP